MKGVDDLRESSYPEGVIHAVLAREQVAPGIELIGLERSEHIQNVIEGMKDVADVLGIRGVDLQGS